MKKDYNVITDIDMNTILEALKEQPMTKYELAEKTKMSLNEISEDIDMLLKNEWVICRNELYYINEEEFQRAAVAFLRFANVQTKTETEDAYHIDISKELYKQFFDNRENNTHHAAFEREISFYESVRSGNLENVKTLYTPLGGEGFGVLSRDPLQNLKFHLVISIALITRFCMNGGMLPEDAYCLSDVYVMKTDECKSADEINKIHYDMTIDFTRRMRQIHTGPYSKPISNVLDYISDNLHRRIFIQDAADYLSLSVPYLSKCFKFEVGMSFSKYVTVKKIEAAASMLQFSDYSALEISNYFAFSSQSHFIKLFREHTGMTPKAYKDSYYAVGWLKKNNSD